jgi:hypothetical protein
LDRLVGHIVAMRTAGAARLGAWAEGLVDDRLDGACAAAAFGAAAEAPLNLLLIARQVRSCNYGTADIVVAKDVTGTNDHEDGRPIGDASKQILKGTTVCKRKNRSFKQFQTDA